MNDTKWYEIHDNLSLTADYMAEHGFTARDLAYFVEKPWKYEEQYTEARAEYEAEMATQVPIG